MTNDFRELVKEVEKTTINIKDNATKVVNTLEKIISNDVIKKKKISLFLRFKLRRQDVTIEKKKILLMYDNY